MRILLIENDPVVAQSITPMLSAGRLRLRRPLSARQASLRLLQVTCRFSLSRSDSSQLAPSPPCFLGLILCSAPAWALSCGFERLKDRGRPHKQRPCPRSLNRSKRSDDRHRYFTAVTVVPSPGCFPKQHHSCSDPQFAFQMI